MRKTMTTGSKTITFHYDEDNNVTHETDGNNQVIASYTYADDQPVSMTRGGKTYYYQTNYRGDVVALTDSAGAVVATYEYDAYGNLLKETGNVENPYRYAGYRYDGETGLYYLQSRYYNPETGRFLTRDTFEGFENEPLSLNKYVYAHNNPVMHTDPSGHVIPALVLRIIAQWAWRAFKKALGQAIINTSVFYNWRGYWDWRYFFSVLAVHFVSNLVPGLSKGIKRKAHKIMYEYTKRHWRKRWKSKWKPGLGTVRSNANKFYGRFKSILVSLVRRKK